MTMNGVSLFSSAGIGEVYLKDLGIEIVCANEIDENRASLFKKIFPKTNMIVGDITSEEVFQRILDSCDGKIDFLIATPPCQGLSKAGKNRVQEDMVCDQRNYLVLEVIKFIKAKNPSFVLIENVPSFLNFKLNLKGDYYTVVELLKKEFSEKYQIESKVLDAADYGTPQHRKRAIIKMYPNNSEWPWPKEEKRISVEHAIGHLPSLEAGDSSELPFHYARKHSDLHIEAMKHTPTDETAFNNKVHFPKTINGQRVKGYNTTYRRMAWNRPAPTITIRNDAISSQRNVHPGRKIGENIYSDARVLTPLELMILMGLPESWNIPKDTPELLIRKCIGEGVPPLLIKKLVQPLVS